MTLNFEFWNHLTSLGEFKPRHFGRGPSVSGRLSLPMPPRAVAGARLSAVVAPVPTASRTHARARRATRARHCRAAVIPTALSGADSVPRAPFPATA
jgi:hypothetical protein